MSFGSRMGHRLKKFYGLSVATLLLTLAGSGLYAATEDIQLSSILEEKLRVFIGRYIPLNQFQVSVRAETDLRKVAAGPYLPDTFSTSSLRKRSVREVAFFTRKITLDIFFLKSIGRETRAQIGSLVSGELELKQSRGDRLTVRDLNIELSEIDQGLGQATQKINNIKGDLEKITSERDEAKRNLSILQVNFDQALKETAISKEMLKTRDQQFSEMKRNLEDVKRTEKTLREDYNKLKEEWEKSTLNKFFSVFGNSIFVSIAGLICAIIFVIGIMKSFTSVASGLKRLSENISGALSSIANSLTMKGKDVDEAQVAEEHVELEKVSDINAQVPGIEELKIYQSSLREEIEKLWKDEFESDVVIYLDNLIRKHKKPSHAMIVFEILGQEKSEGVYRRLSKGAKEILGQFIRNAHYDKPKSVLMIEVGENLKTLLFAEYISKSESNLNQKINESVVKLEWDFIVQIVQDMGRELLPRFLLYLDPVRISRLMKHMYRTDSQKFSRLSECLLEMPASQDAVEQDQPIMKIIDQTLLIMNKNIHKPFFGFYREVLEKTPDEISENIMANLEKKNQELGGFLRTSIITFNSLFSLNREQIIEAVGDLTNHEIGVLITSLQDKKHKDMILKSFGSRRQQMILDELDVVAGRPARQVYDQFQKLKVKVSHKIKRSVVSDQDAPASKFSSRVS